jgi:hypothetical protein
MVALAWTDSPKPSDSRSSPAATALSNRILERLWESICRERDPWMRDDLRIAWMTVKWTTDGVPEWSFFNNQSAHTAATQTVLHCYPDQVWSLINQVRIAKLSREYGRFYQSDGCPQPLDLVEIPDHDPTSELRITTPQSGLMYQMPTACWPTEQDSLRGSQERERVSQPPIPISRSSRSPRSDAKPRPKAPLRLIVSIAKVRDGERVLYHREELECGHSHVEFLGANPGKRSRRCHKCAALEKRLSAAA